MSDLDFELSSPDDKKSRVGLTLARIAKIWLAQPGDRDRNRSFVENTLLFLKTRKSRNENTFRSYSFAILEFFDRMQEQTGSVPTPDQVRRDDAARYVDWLKDRERGLEEFRVKSDPQRGIDAVIYDFVKTHSGANIDQIRKHLELRGLRVDGSDSQALAKRLTCLVERKTLVRHPTYSELRSGAYSFGGRDPKRCGIDYDVDPVFFKYTIPKIEKDELERSSTIASRLLALSSYWVYLSRVGENVGSQEPLIRFNIWSEHLRDVLPKAKSNAKDSRSKRAPTVQLLNRLLATTYKRTHGEKALEAAQAKMRGEPVEEPIARSSFSDLRDRALLLLAVQMGLRASEIVRLRRSDILRGTPPVLSVLGKGDKKRQLRIPPVVLQSVFDLDEKIRQIGKHQAKYKGESRASLMLAGDAPLIPAVVYWGHNATKETKGRLNLTRQGIDAILRRRARQAGFSEDEYRRSHPHGLRHLFAKIASDSGTPINRIQAMLGHSNISTTGIYLDKHEAQDLIAEAFRPQQAAEVLPRDVGIVPAVQPKAPLPKKTFEEKPRVVRIVKEQKALARAAAEKPTKATPATRGTKDEIQLLIESAYAKDTWGERGRTQRLVEKLSSSVVTKESKEEGKPLYLRPIAGLREAAKLEEVGLAGERQQRQLRNIYIGKSSGLLWWYGPGGKLRPEMPVLSADQMGSCDPDQQSALCQRLSDLWMKWMYSDEPDRGPTASSALTMWVGEALTVSRQVMAEAIFRNARWVPFFAPISETDAGEKKGQSRDVFREHQLESISSWFEEVAWKYRVTLGGGGVDSEKKVKRVRESKVDDRVDVPVPSYYELEDPISDLPLEERMEMLDWLASLTDQPIVDRVHRFNGVSRYDLVELVKLFCEFDRVADIQIDLFVHERENDAAIQAATKAREQSKGRVRDRMSSLTFGKVADFDIDSVRKARAAARRGSATTEEEHRRKYRQQAYLEIIEQHFGQKASSDIAVVYAAKCGRAPLSVDYYRKFFRIDRVLNTVVHEREFKKEFARSSGTHSECVARRVARDLWELRLGREGATRKSGEHFKELRSVVTALASYRIPCPASYENELRDLLGRPKQSIPLYSMWSRGVGKEGTLPLTETQLGVIEEQEESGYGLDDLFIPNTGTYRLNGRSLKMIPTPVYLIFLAETC